VAEKSVYPFTHEEVGAYVMKKWNFPDMLTKAILHHHRLDFDPFDDQVLVSLSAVASLADLFCLKLGIGVREPDETIDLAGSRAGELLKLSEGEAEAMLETFHDAFETDRTFFVS
jgi:HD-like signal output (HDOD) protein